jgi:hypothetical protein
MGNVAVVIGQAGTGKTTWLMTKACEFAPRLMTADHQRMLVLTRMHGARRRLEHKLKDSCRNIPYSVTTIDSFALSVVNRWRTALGHSTPVAAVPGDVDFANGVLGIEADFGRIVGSAVRLLQSPIVGGIIAATYPLILIDEFQDCHGPLLEFVTALSKHSSVLLAADDFQLLDSAVTGCPAVAWVRTQVADGAATIEELTTCHRTSVAGILDAARCLRENATATGPTVPVVCCPRHQAAAWKIIDHLVLGWYSPRWTGTCALICPSHGQLLQKVLDSCTSQLQRKNRAPIRWHEEHSAEEEQNRTAASLGLTTSARDVDSSWERPSGPLDEVGTHIFTRVQRFARLRGIDAISYKLVARYVDMAVHEQRAYWSPSSSRTVTTVHGAKNREFNSVFVLWNPFSVCKWNTDDQRRLLYNAITRSKNNCMVLVLGNEDKARNDPVLALLGPPEPAFPAKIKAGKRTTKKARR